MGLNFGQNMFPSRGEALANYDYTDIANGIGYTDYLLGTTFENGTSGAHLLTNAFYSQQVYTGKASLVLSGAIFRKGAEVSFATQFKLPRVIQGTAIANIPVGIYKTSSDGDTFFGRTDIDVFKRSGGAETLMAQVSGAQITTQSAAQFSYYYNVDSISVDIPFTHFKKNDELILVVKEWGKGTDPSAPENRTAAYFIGHDPKNRATVTSQPLTFGTEPSIGSFKVPFKLVL